MGNLHGISPSVHNGGRANFKSAARSDLILSIPQKQKTLNPLDIGSPKLLPNPTKDSLAKDKNTTRFVLSCRLDRLFVIDTVSFLSSSVVNLYLQWQDLSIFKIWRGQGGGLEKKHRRKGRHRGKRSGI